MNLARWWQRRREARALARRAIPDDAWQSVVQRHPFLARLNAHDLAELRRLASLFLDSKEFSGAGGFVVDDDIALAVAAQACLPVLRHGLAPYGTFVGIVMHADEVVAPREVMDEDGIVHAYDEVLAGEAMEGGPVMLSWADVHGGAAAHAHAHAHAQGQGQGQAQAYNVVIHEFAHVLDMGDGRADGVPPGVDRRAWLEVLMPAYDRFSERVVCGHDTVMDPYGAESPDEFFAVASESFFVTPEALKEEQPGLYRLFVDYYRQDPAAG